MKNDTRKIINIGKTCTSKCCGWKNKFPYCLSGCQSDSVKTIIEYENDKVNKTIKD